MAITVPKFYPRPWAANEQLPELTEEEVVTAFPGGDDQRPTRQTLNRALQYATNGVIYYLTHGMPEWAADAHYAAGSIVRNQNDFFLATSISSGVVPYSDASVWEFLPWRKDVLDAIYLTMQHGDAHFLTIASADDRFYSKAQMDALFITPSKMALLYVTQEALAAEYITREQAISLFLTVAIADERYAIYEETVSTDVLTEMLEDYLSIADGKELYLSATGGDETLLNREQAGVVYLTLEDAIARFEAKINAAISCYRPEMIYGFGVLAFDPEERTIYRSLAEDNVGHSLNDEEYWAEWTPPYAEPTSAGSWLHTQGYDASGTYSVAFEDVVPSGTETHGEVLMRFRLKAGGGGGYGIGGGGEGAELTVATVIEESAFPLKLMVGGPGQDSSIGSIGAPLLQVNCGGDAVETWSADHGYDGGGYASNDSVIDTSRVERPAPMEVYQSARFPIDTWFITYTFSNFVPNAPCVVRLHFCEGNLDIVPGERVFDVDVSGQRVLTDFDVVARAGGPLIAHIESFVVPADALGQYVVTVWTRIQAPIIGGIEILALTTLLSVQSGNDATEEEPGLGGDQAMVGLTRGVMSVVKVPGAHGKFAWPGFRGGDGGGNGGGGGEPLRRINCTAVEPYGTWGPDAGFGGGGGHGDPHYDLPIDLSRTLRPAPEAIYRTVRLDDPTPLVYTFGGYAPGSHQAVRLHFCELWVEGDWPHRRFSVVVNDIMILDHFNIIEAAGGARIANVQSTLAAANAQGQIVITFTPIAHPPIIAAIEIFPAEPTPSTMTPINCGAAGGTPAEGWNDRWFSGGSESWVGSDVIVDTSRVERPAPQEVYRTIRFGYGSEQYPMAPFIYTIPPLTVTPGWVYRLRLHFAENWVDVLNRVFHILVNGRYVARDVDVVARAGGLNSAYIFETDVMATDAGLVLSFERVAGNNLHICGIELEWMGSAMPPDASPAVQLGGGGNSEWGPSVRPGAAGFIVVDW